MAGISSLEELQEHSHSRLFRSAGQQWVAGLQLVVMEIGGRKTPYLPFVKRSTV